MSWEAEAEEGTRWAAQQLAARAEELEAKLRAADTRIWQLEGEVRELQEELARRDAGILPFRKEVAG